MAYQHINVPEDGEKITLNSDGTLSVPTNPIIPFIEGDGVGVDITPVMLDVVNAAVEKAYGNDRAIKWMEIYTGEKAAELYQGDWFPAETLDAIKEYLVAIKGPLTTPVGGGFRSLNVALRQELDLYVSVRPTRWFEGVPSPVKAPEKVDVIVFRENAEDVYAGIEWRAGSEEGNTVIDFLQESMGVSKIRFPDNCAIGIKPVSKEGSQRLIRKAINYALDQGLPFLTLVHKGNVLKYTEGAFKTWGYELAEEEFGAEKDSSTGYLRITNPNTGHKLVIKDVMADTMLQELLLRPEEHSVIATLNQNGDYLADALSAQVGGIGISPGANVSDAVALFEATHGTAPRYAGLDKMNPGSLILSAEMMLRHIGWNEAADKIIEAVNTAMQSQHVTFDLAQLIDGATPVTTTAFGEQLIASM